MCVFVFASCQAFSLLLVFFDSLGNFIKLIEKKYVGFFFFLKGEWSTLETMSFRLKTLIAGYFKLLDSEFVKISGNSKSDTDS